jgi:hypothetical protein
MVPGKRYTVPLLACIFEGGPVGVAAALSALCASGKVSTSLNHCGRYRDSREARRNYWVNPFTRAEIAERRWQPADMTGEMTGYDLMAHQRRCMAIRR